MTNVMNSATVHLLKYLFEGGSFDQIVLPATWINIKILVWSDSIDTGYLYNKYDGIYKYMMQ